MDDESEQQFAERILPHIDDSSVLFSEGAFSGPVTPSARNYDAHLAKISQSLAASGKKPILGYADARASQKPKELQKMLNDIQIMIQFCARYIHIEHKPTTIREAVRIILDKQDHIEYVLHIKPDHEIKCVANRVRCYNELFNKSHIRQMTRASSEFQSCFLVAGKAHCIALHLQTGWPMEIFESTDPLMVSGFLQGYYNIQVFPRLMKHL